MMTQKPYEKRQPTLKKIGRTPTDEERKYLKPVSGLVQDMFGLTYIVPEQPIKKGKRFYASKTKISFVR